MCPAKTLALVELEHMAAMLACDCEWEVLHGDERAAPKVRAPSAPQRRARAPRVRSPRALLVVCQAKICEIY